MKIVWRPHCLHARFGSCLTCMSSDEPCKLVIRLSLILYYWTHRSTVDVNITGNQTARIRTLACSTHDIWQRIHLNTQSHIMFERSGTRYAALCASCGLAWLLYRTRTPRHKLAGCAWCGDVVDRWTAQESSQSVNISTIEWWIS